MSPFYPDAEFIGKRGGKSTKESVDNMKFNLMDNVVTRALTKICDMICLNIVWLICCIPIVTSELQQQLFILLC